MKHTTLVKLVWAVTAAVLSGGALPAGLTPAQIQQFSQNADRDVIVILRDQVPNLPANRGTRQARKEAVAAAQAPILSELKQVQAPKVRTFSLINAVAATVSKPMADHLAAHPLVQAVVPDGVIRMPKRTRRTNSPESGDTGSGGGSAPDSASALCGTLEPEALQLTNAAFSDPSRPQAQSVLDGNGKLVTGQGVKVAFLADGVDTTIPGFTRPDGSSVFIDYQDFSGDGPGAPTSGAEAFGDASSIAGQDMPNGQPLTFDISQFVSPAHPLPSPCNIRIRGMAPGASLVGLKVFPSSGFSTNSATINAIEYAVLHDDVDVINESFGSNIFPDNANDTVSLANAAAIKAGVTVVVSTGDSGSAGTLGTPATDPDVIAAGASTQFRLYAQNTYASMALSNGGYVSDNISALSSGGFAQVTPRTVDVVAPGDLGWAFCSTDTTTYGGCGSLIGAPSPIEAFGGTSEAAPLTAGVAALVIQAYRSTHGGADPSPSLVKQIIMSTASDLGAPSYEQGAGLINALKAVDAALSVQDAHGSPSARGNGLLSSPTSSAIVDMPNAAEKLAFTITNTGSTTQHLSAALQTLGPAIAGASLTLQLNPATDPTFPNVAGARRSYIEQTLVVPEGAQHLDAAIAYPSALTSGAFIVWLDLLDPSGREAAYSLPQGSANGYGHVDVVHPTAGNWTAVIFTRPSGGAGSYSGPVQFTWSAERYGNFGSVSPASFDLAAGASKTITAAFSMPAQPGDLAAAIRFRNSEEESRSVLSDIPVTLRTLIPIGPAGGSFSGSLTGGNGRNASGGPTQTFNFDVPSGFNNMSLALQIADPNYLLQGELVDPNGMELSVEPNVDVNGNVTTGLQLSRSKPQPGRWRFVLLDDYFSSGNQTSIQFAAQIAFNTAKVAAPSLPNSAGMTLHAGVPVTFPIAVTNTGAVTQAYFADARLSGSTDLTLSAQPSPVCATTTLPEGCVQIIVPTQVSRVQFLAQSSAPINMDVYPNFGLPLFFSPFNATDGPDLGSRPIGADTVEASLKVPEVPFGAWVLFPSLLGPFAATPPSLPLAAAAIVQTQPFDASVSADSGDVWADAVFGTSTFKPLVLAPGQSGTIHVTITPPKQIGAVVSGHLYIDTFNPNVATGDEVVRIPYRYKVVH
jgi:Subtilase family